MPGFVKKALHQLQHPTQTKPQHVPAKAEPINYGAKQQSAIPKDTSQPLSKEGIRRIQKAVGTFAWYSRAIDSIMAKSLCSIAGRQAKASRIIKRRTQPFFGLLCNTSRCQS